MVGVSALVALESSMGLLYELLRRTFGYHDSHDWSFLHDVLPLLLVAGALWAYHWLILRHQSALEKHPGLIAWPRRLYLAALSFVGLAIAAPAAVSLLWLVIDALFKSSTARTSRALLILTADAGLSSIPTPGAFRPVFSLLQKATHWRSRPVS